MPSVVTYALTSSGEDGEWPLHDASVRAALASFGFRLGDPRSSTEAVPHLLLRGVDWRGDDFDLLAFDDQVWMALDGARACEIRLEPDGLTDHELLRVGRQVVTRYQRHAPVRNAASSVPSFDDLLAAHARLHDRSKPLVAADHDHAIDTWCWVLRLEPAASLPLQLAALFHDVERLHTESEVRVEQHAADYVAFKTAHAAVGGGLVAEVLTDLAVPAAVVERTRALVAEHEGHRQGDDRESAVLNEADALSFFSLNASGFLRYYGEAHTARKVAYTWARLGPVGRRELRHLKLAAKIQEMLPAPTCPGDGPDQADENLPDASWKRPWPGRADPGWTGALDKARQGRLPARVAARAGRLPGRFR